MYVFNLPSGSKYKFYKMTVDTCTTFKIWQKICISSKTIWHLIIRSRRSFSRSSNFHSIYLQGSFWGRVHNLFIRIPNRIRELFPDCDWKSGVRFLYWLSGGNGVSHVDTFTWVKLNKPNIIKIFTDILSRFLAFHIPN